MKHAAATSIIAAMLAGSMPVAFAQDAGSAPVKPVFDADLARRTGADAMGMRQYVLAVL